MDTIMTKDDIVYIWDTRKDFTELCRKYISDEAAEYIDAVLEDLDSENEYQRNLFQSDFHALELEVEDYRNELYDIKEELEKLMVDADDISKKKIVKKIDEMWTHLQKIL